MCLRASSAFAPAPGAGASCAWRVPRSSQQRVRRRGYTVPALHAAADPAPPASAAMPSLGRIIELRLQQRIISTPSSCHATASTLSRPELPYGAHSSDNIHEPQLHPQLHQLGPGCRTQPAHAGHLHAAHRTQQPGSAGGHETPLRPPRALPAAQTALLAVAGQGSHARQRRCAGHGSPKNCV
jgi:hypothetical protein